MGKLGTHIRLLAILIILLTPFTSARAALLDFEALPFTSLSSGGDNVPVAGSVLTNDFGVEGVLFGLAGGSAGVAVVRDSLAPSSGVNSVAGLDVAGIIPGTQAGGSAVGDIFFSFVVPGTTTPAVTDLVSFTIGDEGGDLDVFQIRAYDLSDALISTQNVSNVARFPVNIGVAGIHRVEVDFTGAFGYSLDDLAFNRPAPAPVPATLVLLGGGLAAIGTIALRHRRRL